MFLKVFYQNNMKKVKLPNDIVHDYEQFIEYVSNVISQPKDKVKMNFKDSEGDTINIEDVHDLEYFFHHFKADNFA